MQKRSVRSSRVGRKSAVPHEREQLIQLVLTLSREVALLREDNQQLRAAVGIYRGIAQRMEGAGSSARCH